jgi:hypothetical protein
MELADLASLSDLEAGAYLGWAEGSKKSASRGKQAKLVVLEALGLPAGQRLPLHDIKSAVHKDAIDALFTRFPDFLLRTEGYLPRAPAMMALVRHQLGGAINSANLSAANEVCSGIVDGVLGPRLRKFIKETLHPDGDFKPLGQAELLEFLTGPYAQYAKAEANGLISRAGSLNEALVREAIVSAGLHDAIQTGTEGNADIQIVTKALNPPQILSIEVKSYGARERLVRGLHDCKEPKVGVGFFNKPSEFNADRTTQLRGTNASAIYLPETTFSALDENPRSRQNDQGGQFYRSLSCFGSDMKLFSQMGAKAFSSSEK